MHKTTPAPKVQRENLLVVPYLYAAVLAGGSVYQLVAFEDFLQRTADYVSGGNLLATFIAAGIIGLQIAGLPFLLRLYLSPLARMLSALSLLLLPVIVLFLSLQALLRGIVLGPTDYLLAQPLDWIVIVQELVLIGISVASFIILRGSQVFHFPKK